MKAILLLKRNASLTSDQFRSALEKRPQSLAAPFAQFLLRHQHNYPEIAAWCSPADLVEAPYDCIVQLWFSDRAGLKQLRSLCRDHELRSGGWAGVLPLIDPGETMCFEVTECNSSDEPAVGKIKGMSFHSRRPHLTREQFRDYYETRHAALVARLFDVPRRYQRNYPDSASTCLPAGLTETPFDSVTQTWYDDLDTMERFRTAITDPDILKQIKADEQNFLDGSKSILFQVEEIEHHL